MKKEINIKEFLDSNEIKYYENDTHLQANCFLCGDQRNRLGIDKESNHWQCFNCGSNGKKISSLVYGFNHKGKIKPASEQTKDEKEEKCTIASDFHLKFHEYIKKTDKYESARYLIKERKLTKEAIKYFQIGARKTFVSKSGEKYSKGEYVAIPYIKDGKCVNVKYRALDPEVDKKDKWLREKGGISSLFNDQVLSNLDYKTLFIVESEIDCMSLWVMGIKNVVGLTVGAKGFKQAWYDRLERFEKIYIVLDNDKDGQEGAEKLAKRLGMGRCYNIVLPSDVKDPNDYLKKHTLEDFNQLVASAKQFDIRGVVSLKKSVQQLLDKLNSTEEEDIGYQTQWPRMNKVLGSLKPGFLTVVSGKPKSGKTTWVLDNAFYWTSLGIPVGMYSCEMQHIRLSEKFIARVTPEFNSVRDLDEVQLSYASWRLRSASRHFHMYYPEMGDLELDKVIARVTEMVQRYGLKIFIFDNLHFLCRGEDEKTMIDKATQAFKLLAENLGIVFILITHPRKTNNNKQLTNEDMKGSSSIFQDADLIILMHRRMKDGDMLPDEIEKGVAEGAMSARAEFLITGRFVEGGKTYLALHGRRSMFKDKGTLFNECMKDIIGKKKKKGF